ncbi:7-cyano-7-deazaguanine synthase QueC [Microtetraspora malaysiensis]|uniref:7-cyano-7-deazaguanine synthase n=1 Tax=Microtetraspora malaysiensis TaxID=161358 RepID=A0ABW6SKN1_9ACTN
MTSTSSLPIPERLKESPAGRHIRHAVTIVSGGLDSITLAYWLHAHTERLTLLSADYGQRHVKELQFARTAARDLNANHEIVDLTSVGTLLQGSALTDTAVAMPDGHYTDTSMSSTVVANRNALLLDIASAVAVAVGADIVAYGAHAGDHTVYPDCRGEFVDAYRRMVLLANEGFIADGFDVVAPFLTWSKADIIALGAQLAVPFGATWSCYRGGDVHCGTCGTCVERREAFTQARVPDPTVYQTALPEVG